MSSFINKKTRVFREQGDNVLASKKSEGRMKTYPSATDARAWSDDYEERRQYILELIKQTQAKGLAIGRYIPIEVIIDTLLADKNAEIDRLKKLLEQYEQLELTDEQKSKLAGMQAAAKKIGGKVADRDEGREKGREKGISGKVTDKDDGREKGVREKGVSEKVADKDDGREKGVSGKVADKDDGREKGMEEDDNKARDKSGMDAADKPLPVGKSALESQSVADDDRTARSKTPEAAMTSDRGSVGRKKAAGTADVRKNYADEYTPKEMEDLLNDKDAALSTIKNALAARENYCEEQHKLAQDAIEQLENIKGIIEERDDLRKRLKKSQEELNTLKKQVGPFATLIGTFETCEEEIVILEQEIEAMKNDDDPAVQSTVIKKEVEVLKKYCAKLANIQEDNQRLRREREFLKSQITKLEAGEIPESLIPDVKNKLAEYEEMKKERDNLKYRIGQLEQELAKFGDLPENIDIYRQRSSMLDTVLQERDSLHRRLQQMAGLGEETEELKRQAMRVKELERLLADQQRGSNVEILGMKTNCAEVTKQLDEVSAERDLLQKNVNDLRSELDQLNDKYRDYDDLKTDRDRLLMRLEELADMEEEYRRMEAKIKCCQTIIKERDMFKEKYEELLGLECECDMLRAQVEKARCIECERDGLQREVCDLQCCIQDQENEIRKLVGHVDRLVEGRDEQQAKVKDTLTSMRAELEKKDELIASSEEKLAKVQERLRSSIQAVTHETGSLRSRIDELEEQLCNSNNRLAEKQSEVDYLYTHIQDKDGIITKLDEDRRASKEFAKNEYDALTLMKEELEKARSENEKLQFATAKMGSIIEDGAMQEVLKQSKCAVLRIAEELGKQYENWDCMQQETVACRNQQEPRIAYINATSEQTAEVPGAAADVAQERDCKELEIENQRLKRELDDANSKICELECALENAAPTENVPEGAEVGQLQETIKQLKTRIAELEAALRDTERMGSENKALRRHSTEVQEVAKDQIAELVEHLRKARERIAELEDENDKIKKQLHALENQLRAASTGDAAPPIVSESMERLRRELEAIQQEKEALQKLIQDLQGGKVVEVGDDAELARLKGQHAEALLKIGELEKYKTSAENRIRDLENELALFKSDKGDDKGDAISELAKLRKDYADAQNKIRDLENELALFKSDKGDAVSELANLRKDYADAQNKIRDLENELALLKSDKGGPVSELANLRKDDGDAQSKIRDLENALSSLKSEKEDAATELAKLKKDYAEAENKIRQLENEVALLKAGAGDEGRLMKENELLKQENDKLKTELLKAETRIKDLEENIKRLSGDSKELDNLLKELEKIKAEKSDLESRLGSKSGDAESLKNENNNLKSELDKLRQELENIKKASAETDSLRKELERLQQENDKYKSDMDSRNKEISDLKKEKDDINNKLAKTERDLNNTAKSSSVQEEQLQSENVSLKKTNEILQKENETLRSEKENLKKENETLKSEISSLKNQLDSLKNEIETLKTESQSLKSQLDSLRSENSDLKKQVEALKKDLESASKSGSDNVNILKSEFDSLKKENDGLKKEIADMKNEMEILKKENELLKGEITALKRENEDLIKANDALKKENITLLDKTGESIPQTPAPLDAADLDKERKEKAALQAMIDDLRNQLQHSVKEIPPVPTEGTDVSGALQDLTKKVEEEQREAERAKEALKKQKLEADKLRYENEQLQKQVDQLNAKIAKLEADLNEARSASGGLKALQDELNTLRKQNNDLENELKNCRDKVAALEKQLELERSGDTDAVKAGLEARIKELEAQLSQQKKEGQDALAALKNQYERDMKNLMSRNETSITKLQGSHEETMKDFNKDYEDEIKALKQHINELEKENQELKAQLQQSKEEKPLDKTTFENVSIFPDIIPLSTPISNKKLKTPRRRATSVTSGSNTPSLTNILNKILDQGIQSLTYEELHRLHSRTCDAAANTYQAMRTPGSGPRATPQPSCICAEANDRLGLVKRISALENELIRKQKHAQQKVAALQMNVKLEKQHLDELKRTLELERQKNSDLLSKINLHSKAVVNLQVERDLMQRQHSHHEEKLQKYLNVVEKEKHQVQRLKQDLHAERQQNQQLMNMLGQAKEDEKKDLRVTKVKYDQPLNRDMQLSMKLHDRCSCPHSTGSTTNDSPLVPQVTTKTLYTEFIIPVQDPNNSPQLYTHRYRSRDTRQKSCRRPCKSNDSIDIDET